MEKLLDRYLNVDFISYFSFFKVYLKKYMWFLSLNIEILKPWEFIFLEQNFKIFSTDNEGAPRVFKVCVKCVRAYMCVYVCVCWSSFSFFEKSMNFWVVPLLCQKCKNILEARETVVIFFEGKFSSNSLMSWTLRIVTERDFF